MLEDREDELHSPEAEQAGSETTEETQTEEKSPEPDTEKEGNEELSTAKEESKDSPTPEESTKGDAQDEIDKSNTKDSEDTENEGNAELSTAKEEGKDSPTPEEGIKGDAQDEIDKSNAEDSEDTENERRHEIPVLDYHSMGMENLVGELQRLVRNEKVQAIKRHVEGIKYEFDLKFKAFIEEKKEEFLANGGNEADFRYNSVTKRQFNEVYSDYREKRNQYYKNLEKQLKENLENRLQIIEELKGLVSVEEDMHNTYKNFKGLQERWRNAGPVPRNQYNDVWRTYHHHLEIFYDFLHLNRELRDLDFKHNLQEKTKLIERAEALAQEPDIDKAFRELQTLHKIWKEDIGPVGKEQREPIWERFSAATKAVHQRRQNHLHELEKRYEENLLVKNGLIEKIREVAASEAKGHQAIQRQIKEIEALRDSFFKAGKVPQKVNEATWAAFKEAVRDFNRKKNAFYKGLKKEQLSNLDKKRALLEKAESLKDSEDWETTTQEMKRIQAEWKTIGHVPRKYSDKIWKEFKAACNHYFDRFHARRNQDHEKEKVNLKKKMDCMDRLRAFQLSGEREKDLNSIKAFINEWKGIGRVPYHKKSIDQRFNKILDALFKKMDVGRQESELLKYGNKIQQLAKKDDDRAIFKERLFIKRKIDETNNEIRQLENNLQFFSNSSEDNPLVKEVYKNVEKHKTALAIWKEKLKKLNIMENNLGKETDESKSEQE